jgi:hypothetical protein
MSFILDQIFPIDWGVLTAPWPKRTPIVDMLLLYAHTEPGPVADDMAVRLEQAMGVMW